VPKHYLFMFVSIVEFSVEYYISERIILRFWIKMWCRSHYIFFESEKFIDRGNSYTRNTRRTEEHTNKHNNCQISTGIERL